MGRNPWAFSNFRLPVSRDAQRSADMELGDGMARCPRSAARRGLTTSVNSRFFCVQ